MLAYFTQNVNKIKRFLWWCLVVTIPLERADLLPFISSITLRPYQLIAVLLLAVMIAEWFFLKKKNWKELRQKLNLTDRLLLIFLAGGFLAVYSTYNPNMAFKQAVILLSFAAIYFLTRAELKKPADFYLTGKILLAVGFFISLGALIQNWLFVHHYNSGEVMPGRPDFGFAEPDWLAMYLVMNLALIYTSLLVWYEKKLDKSKREGAFLTVALVVDGAALLLTVARSAWLGAAVVTVLFFILTFLFWHRSELKKWWRLSGQIILGFLVALGLIYFLSLTNFKLEQRWQSAQNGWQTITVSCSKFPENLPKKINRMAELEKYGCRHINLEEIKREREKGHYVTEIARPDPNVNLRRKIYETAWQEIKKHWWRGIGGGNSALILGKDELGHGFNASNIFLEIWLSNGLLGLASFLGILGILIWQTFHFARNFLSYSRDFFFFANIFLVLSLAAFLIPNLFNAGLLLGWVWLWLGAVSRILSGQKEKTLL